eukprot:4885757-Amphidinium_carterae.1
MTWRLAVGALLLSWGSVRNFLEAGNSYLAGGVSAREFAAEAEFVGHSMPEDAPHAEKRNESENWSWRYYQRSVEMLQSC